MKKEICSTLAEIEKLHNVKILYACESGSRAWGFPSPDSDYDARYLYIRPLESYLKLFPERDVIEGPIDEVKDFVGWDLQKALKLLMKGNAPLIEWVRSPIVYKDNRYLEAIQTCTLLLSSLFDEAERGDSFTTRATPEVLSETVWFNDFQPT